MTAGSDIPPARPPVPEAPMKAPEMLQPQHLRAAADLRIGKIAQLPDVPSVLNAVKPVITIGALMGIYYYGIKMILTGKPQFPFKRG